MKNTPEFQDFFNSYVTIFLNEDRRKKEFASSRWVKKSSRSAIKNLVKVANGLFKENLDKVSHNNTKPDSKIIESGFFD